jgi:hypothetical protein
MGELNEQQSRLSGARDVLQKAEDIKAAAELQLQKDEYATIKAARDAVKVELDALLAKDEAGTLDEAGYTKLDLIESESFAEAEEIYQNAKQALEDREREANDKAFNKASADSEKLTEELKEANARQTEAKKLWDTAKAA